MEARSLKGSGSSAAAPNGTAPPLLSAIRCAKAALIVSSLRSQLAAANKGEQRQGPRCVSAGELRLWISVARFVRRTRSEERRRERSAKVETAQRVLIAVIYALALCVSLGLL